MIKIVNNGREKTFVTRCAECATDFEYENEDIMEIEAPEMVPSFRLGAGTVKIRRVICPVCGESVDAWRMTEEDFERGRRGFPVGWGI